MSTLMERIYQQRLKRYTTALHNDKPDQIPLRPFVAEFVAKYAGYTNQQVTHDLDKVFDAVCQCCSEFDWDATVPNMVHMWVGLTHAIDLKCYAYPGIDWPPDGAAQYIEPPEEEAFMKADEYDQLIEDPTGFLFNVWYPRITNHVSQVGEPTSLLNNLSFLKGGIGLHTYFGALGGQVQRMRSETGTVSAISGLLKAPLDIIGDRLRGYIGLSFDLMEQPDKVLAACQALAPHLTYMALAGADPDKNVPVAIWMHRGGVPFVSPEHFRGIYWATLKPMLQEIHASGHQVLFYAEGNWDAHLDSFAELPDGSIIFHCDQGDIFNVHKALGHKFCLSGGVPNFLLSYGTPDQVRDCCKRIIDEVAADGGYIMDASAIMQDDTKTENLRAMTDFTREYGAY